MKAFVTALTSISYIDGVNKLSSSLKHVNSKYDLYCVIPKRQKELSNKLTSCKSIVIDDLDLEYKNDTGYWQDTLFKLKVFSLIQFEKIVFLDSDMFILKNIDFLFDKLNMSAVASGNVLHNDWNQLNSGLFVVEPNIQEYKEMISIINDSYEKCKIKGIGFSDQNVINDYFCNWENSPELHLPDTLNCMLGYGNILLRNHIIAGIDDIFVYHFTGKEKPWMSIKELLIIILKIFLRTKKVLSLDMQILLKYIRINNVTRE